MTLSSASVLTKKVNCDQINNKIDAGMERLLQQLWQKSKEFEKYLAELEVFMSFFRGKKIKGVLRELVEFLEQKLREVRMQNAIK